MLEDYAKSAIADGALVEVLTDWSPQLPSWFLYYPRKSHHRAAMRAFLDFVSRSTRQARPNADRVSAQATTAQ